MVVSRNSKVIPICLIVKFSLFFTNEFIIPGASHETVATPLCGSWPTIVISPTTSLIQLSTNLRASKQSCIFGIAAHDWKSRDYFACLEWGDIVAELVHHANDVPAEREEWPPGLGVDTLPQQQVGIGHASLWLNGTDQTAQHAENVVKGFHFVAPRFTAISIRFRSRIFISKPCNAA